jgi:hypothetical protein
MRDMKTLLLFVAMIVGFGLVSMADEPTRPYENQKEIDQREVTQTRGEYTAISVDDLPDAVKKAARKEEGVTIDSAEMMVLPNGERVYKLTLQSAEKGEYTKTFYADGREYRVD